MSDLRETSKRNWNGGNSLEAINCGSLQRIADASEIMAQNHKKLIADRDMYEKLYNEHFSKVMKRDRTISALRGQITKLKKKIAIGE